MIEAKMKEQAILRLHKKYAVELQIPQHIVDAELIDKVDNMDISE